MSEPLIITRYRNRKLYVAGKGYLNLAKVRAAILEGQAVQVICAETRDIITPSILGLVIAEDARQGRVPELVLLNCIRVYGPRSNEDELV